MDASSDHTPLSDDVSPAVAASWQRVPFHHDPTLTVREGHSAAVSPPQSPPRAGDLAYRVEQVVAEHDDTVLISAEQSSLARPVLLVRGLNDAGRSALGMVRTARLLSRVEHPGVVPVHDAGPGWMAIDAPQGRCLAAVLDEWGRPAPSSRLPELVEIMLRVAETVVHLHDNGVLHRTLSPHTVQVGAFGEVVLVGWTAACHYPCPADEQPDICVGAPAYVPPEAARGEPTALHPAWDCYLLGAMLYEILSGRPPRDDDDARQCLDQAAAGCVPPPLAGTLGELAMQLLDPIAQRRPSALETATRLRTWLQTSAHRDQAAALCQQADALLAEATVVAAEQAAALARRAVTLDPSSAAGVLHDMALQQVLEVRLDDDDLAAAGDVVAALRDVQQRAAAEHRLARARRWRQWRRRGAVLLRLLAVAGILVVVTAGFGLLRWWADSGARLAQARRAEAAALRAMAADHQQQAEQLTAGPHIDNPVRMALMAAAAAHRRALGLDPGPRAKQDLRAVLRHLVRHDMERQDPAAAEGLVAELALLDDPQVADLASALAAQRAQLAAAAEEPRRQRLAAFRRATGIDDPLAVASEQVAQAAARLAAWPDDERDALVAWAAQQPQPMLRRVAMTALARVPEADGAIIIQGLADDDIGVVAAALAAAARMPSPPSAAVLAALREIAVRAGETPARELGLAFADPAALASALGDTLSVTDRVLLGDHHGALRRALADPEVAVAERILAAELAERWTGDLLTARSLVADLDPGQLSPEQAATVLAITRRQADPTQAWTRAQALRQRLGPGDGHLPIQILLCALAADDADAALTLADDLPAVTTQTPAAIAHLGHAALLQLGHPSTPPRLDAMSRHLLGRIDAAWDGGDADLAFRLALLLDEYRPGWSRAMALVIMLALNTGDVEVARSAQRRMDDLILAQDSWRRIAEGVLAHHGLESWRPAGIHRLAHEVDGAVQIMRWFLEPVLSRALAPGGDTQQAIHLAEQLRHGSRGWSGADVIAVRLLLAHGDGAGALAVVEQHAPHRGREAFDELLFSIPGLRSQTWPGFPAPALARRAAAAAGAAHLAQDLSRAQYFADLAAAHDPDIGVLAQAIAGGDRPAVTAWITAHHDEAAQLGWPLAYVWGYSDPALLGPVHDWHPNAAQWQRLRDLAQGHALYWPPAALGSDPDAGRWAAEISAHLARFQDLLETRP